MRFLLLHNRLHRAFPELDPYTDDRCLKFVRAAQRGRVRRAFHIAIILCVSGLVLFGGVFLALWLLDRWNSGNGSGSDPLGAWLAVILLFVCSAPVAGYLTRDWLLRRRVRYVLRSRGTCSRCRYSLVGLPVGPDSFVTCPECGEQTEVDPSLGELVLDDAGLGRFRPSPAALPRPPRIFTPHRVRILKRVVVVLALVLGTGIPAVLGGYELWLRRQASVAQAEKPGAEALKALVEANQPAGSEGGANAWDVFQEAVSLRGQADLDDENLHPETSADKVYADFSWLYVPLPHDGTPDELRQYQQSAEKARRLLDAYRKGGVFHALDRMAAAPRVIPAMSLPQGQPITNLGFNDLGPMRNFARVNVARMKLASESGDLAEFTSAAESTFALARIGNLQPLLIDHLVGDAIELLAYSSLQDFLRTHPSREWIDAVDAAIARQRVTIPAAYVWEGERLYTLDQVAWVFSDPARVRWGRASPEVDAMFYQPISGRLGTYAHNRDELNKRFRAAAQAAALPRWQRPQSGPEPDPLLLISGATVPGESGLPLIDTFVGHFGMALRSFDQAELTRSAYPLQSALERYFAAHGAYPDSLGDLVPSFLSEIPADPWTGKTFGYHLRPADAPSNDPRGYILYSFGSDGTDNAGSAKRSTSGAQRALLNDGAGSDFIINDWTPPQE